MIIWTRVTWYSKLLAAIFFVFLFPALTFFLGKEYAYTEGILENQSNSIEKIEEETQKATEASVRISRSGITGQALYADGQPFQGNLTAYEENRIITQTLVRPDGKFLLFLNPGEYTLTSNEGSLTPLPVLVEAHVISHVTISE
jgi:hypothetical protein